MDSTKFCAKDSSSMDGPNYPNRIYWTPLISLTTYHMTVWVSNSYIVSLSSNTRRTPVRILANHAPRYRVRCPFFSFPTPIFKNSSPKPWAWDPLQFQPFVQCLQVFRFGSRDIWNAKECCCIWYGLNMVYICLNMFKWCKAPSKREIAVNRVSHLS